MKGWIAVAVLMLAATPAAGQDLRIEVRGGVAVGAHSSTEAALDLAPNMVVGGFLSYPVRDKLSVFGGYSYHRYGCDNGFCWTNETITNSHGILGVEYDLGLGWARVGGMFGSVGINNTVNVGPGAYASGGIRAWLGPLAVRPGLSFRWMKAGEDSAVSFTGEIGLEFNLRDIRLERDRDTK